MKSNQPTKQSVMTMVVRKAQVIIFLLVVAQWNFAVAEDHELVADEPKTLEDALFGGTVKLDLRIRAEIADQDGFDTSEAYTERLRLGYETRSYNGWTFYAELEDIRSVDEDRYNAAGLNGNPTKTVISDPEDTELNQAYVKYDWKDANTQFVIGRQRVILDDARFVGNVGWRQNEQTYDAATIVSQLAEEVTLIYSFIWDVNRVFGPDSELDLSSESHALNLSVGNDRDGKFTFFAYHLDVDGLAAAPALSTDTVGVRYAAKRILEEGGSLDYVFSYARQVDGGDNAATFEADYFLGEVNLNKDGGMVGVGYEVLGSDDGEGGATIGFSTPLATGHKFNGWADAFLATPATGLQDAYVQAGTKLPGGASAKVVYHWFWTEKGGGDLGDEIDVVLKKKLSKRTTAMAKYARFNGVGTTADRNKFWLQLSYKF